MRIVTHQNVDLDAVASVWAAREYVYGAKNWELVFKPANWNGGDAQPEDLILDIWANGKGIKGEVGKDGAVHSSFATLMKDYAPGEDQFVLRGLISFIDEVDSYGRTVADFFPEASAYSRSILLAVNLVSVFAALKSVHAGPDQDTLTVQRMSEIFSGMLHEGKSYQRGIEEAKKVEILPGGRVAIVRDVRERSTMGIVFRSQRVAVIVYTDSDGIGLVRSKKSSVNLRMDHPEIRRVVIEAGEEKEWFAHPMGFLFCRGSRKAPVSSLSKVDPNKLALAADRLLP